MPPAKVPKHSFGKQWRSQAKLGNEKDYQALFRFAFFPLPIFALLFMP